MNALRDNIESVTGQVANGARELDAATESVRREVAESDKQLSAFNNFSAIHLDKITGDLNATKELLAKLQGEECKKTNDKHAVRKARVRGGVGTLENPGRYPLDPFARHEIARVAYVSTSIRYVNPLHVST